MRSHAKRSDSQFERQETEDDGQVRVEEVNLIAEGLKQMWDGVTYQIKVTHDPKEQKDGQVTLIIRNVQSQEESKEAVQLQDRIVAKNNSFIDALKGQFEKIMLSVNYSQSTGKAEIDWKHFEKLTKKVVK